MADHYFSSRPESEREGRTVHARLLGLPFTFRTDAGVFSKKGVDFGSRLLIETVEIGRDASFLDLGCGYGAVGIAIARAYPETKATLVDINERAVQLAEENARLNGVEDRVRVQVSDGFAMLAGEEFNHILFNPPIRAGKVVVYRLFAEAKEALRPGGSLWVVIRKQQGSASAKKELDRLYGTVNLVKQKKGYWILQAVNN